jgi:hypothetical protein
VLGSRQPSGTTTTNSVTAITGGPATPAATTAVLTASAPATVAAAYVMTPLICGAAIGTPAPRATWNWDVTLTETAGVAVTITQEHFANDAIVRTRNVFIPAGRSFVDRFSPYRLSAPCFNGVWVASPGTVSDVYEGVDANGHAVTATVTVRLAT